LRLPRVPRDVVLRPRLLDAVDAGVGDCALTLLSAQPGAGKTILLTSWLRERRPAAPVAWLALGAPAHASFWAHVLEAVKRALPEDDVLHALAAPRDESETSFADRFVDWVAELDTPLVLVIDDLHLLPMRGLTELDRVLRAAPAPLCVVAASRHDPTLGIHALRMTGDLAEIRARDLAFTHEEARELFRRMNVAVGEPDLDAVLARTEGWAAGLRLLALSLQRPHDGSIVEQLVVDERPAIEYLAQEVLDGQPADLRAFLLRTSIVDGLDGRLAAALSARPDAERLLAGLFRDNVFIERLEGDPPAYRYHPLFAALLRAEARIELRDELPVLHARAALALAARGRAVAAVRHAVAAGQWELVSTLLGDHWATVFSSGEIDGADDLVAAVPQTHASAAPVISAFRALLRLSAGEGRPASALLDFADAHADDVPPEARRGLDSLSRYARTLEARAHGDAAGAATLAAEQVEHAPVEAHSASDEDRRRALGLASLGAAHAWLGAEEDAQAELEEAVDLARGADVPFAEIDALAHLALLEVTAGRLRRAAGMARAALNAADVHGLNDRPSSAVAHTALARVEHQSGDLDAAQAAAARADALARRAGDVPSRILAAAAASAVAASRGGDAADEALLHLRAARRRLPTAGESSVARSLTALEARLLAETARTDEAALLVACADGDPDLAVARARLHLAASEPERALGALSARRRGTLYVEIEAHVTEALARRAGGEDGTALTALSTALDLAEPEAVRRPFVDGGLPVRDLLGEHLRRSNVHRWLATALVQLFDGCDGAKMAAPVELLEPLSEREGDVLRYLPTIMSNADIAGELFVSVNTVKTHVKSIYRKLGATRRQEAVRRARQLRLL
jgi:LuxR family maltose regulon positive regulatory protein